MNKDLKVLIVEDDVIAQMTLESMLNQLDIQKIRGVNNAEDALEIIADQKIDIVLLDILIKGDKDGLELAKEIEQSYGIPTIFLTASTDKHTAMKAMQIKNYGFLSKPYDFKKIHEAMRKAIVEFD
ncbi:MAG TPA: response regulator [Cyclobacteriaceae bacterium]